MKIVVGLGNPGKEYENTRHNAGFEALDKLADQLNASVTKKEFRALTGKAMIGGESILLMKPQTYMNLSGESLRAAADYYHVRPEDVVVLCDDMHLETGRLRIRKKGSAGGHNGLKNIALHLGTEDYPRIRIGVGDCASGAEWKDHVLGKVTGEDRKHLDGAQELAADAVVCLLEEGCETAMNRYNGGIA